MHGTVFEIGLRAHAASGGAIAGTGTSPSTTREIRDEILSVDDPVAPGNSLTTNVDRTIHAGVEALVGASFAIAGSERTGSSRSSA